MRKSIALCIAGLFASQILLFAGRQTGARQGLVVHEWGTFTSVQGADGVPLEWNPLVTTDLPDFVYDAAKPTSHPYWLSTMFASKSAIRTVQRMETPVIYFYAPKETTVDLTVEFPQGRITEWYPQAADIGPSTVKQGNPIAVSGKSSIQAINKSLIRWTDIQVLPDHASIPALIPADGSQSHYYAARETDSDLIRVNNRNGSEHERFLFYRGVGSFAAPLKLTLRGTTEDELNLRNNGSEELRHLFVISMRSGTGAYRYLDRLQSQTDQTIKLDSLSAPMPISTVAETIGKQMAQSLSVEGLYAREAEAMVNTWRDSWFEESGLRVLYVLPRSWTDRTLPLKMTPKPRQIVRVMVGRSEMITPSMEWEVLKQVVRYHESSPQQRAESIGRFRDLALGRFAEPVVRRVLGSNPNKQFNEAALALLESTRPGPATKTLATSKQTEPMASDEIWTWTVPIK